MPSALETLVKILKLEQGTGYRNMAVIGGLQAFAENWSGEAHRQARRPEHHQLVDELTGKLRDYAALDTPEARHEAIRYMLGRVTGRIPPPADIEPAPPSPQQFTGAPSSPAAPASRDEIVEGTAAGPGLDDLDGTPKAIPAQASYHEAEAVEEAADEAEDEID